MIVLNKVAIDQSTAAPTPFSLFGQWPVYANLMRSKTSTDYSHRVIVEAFTTGAEAMEFARQICACQPNYAYTVQHGRLKKLGSIKTMEAAAAAAANADPVLF